jgi:transcription elongation GreA/GreB family factor
MSVAFRRESDEEHKEPRFELPLPPGPNLVTPRGLVLIQAKVAELEAAATAEHDEAALETLRRELRYWHTRQTTAEIAPAPGSDEVAIGSRVKARVNGATRTIEIVGHDEADPATDRIAFAAPLARAMLGAETGERLDFNGRPGAIEILAIDAQDWSGASA